MALLGLCLETFFQCTILSYPGQPPSSHAFRWASDLVDWGPDWCESRRRAHSPIGVSFECPYQHPPWSSVSIGKPAPKIHQWTIYFCRWGFGWIDKAQCFRSAGRFGTAGSSPDISWFHDMALLGLCLETFFQCTILSYPGQPPPLIGDHRHCWSPNILPKFCKYTVSTALKYWPLSIYLGYVPWWLMGAVPITSLNPKFNRSHFGLPPSSIHRMTGWVVISHILWRMRTAPTSRFFWANWDIQKKKSSKTQSSAKFQ